MSQPSSTEHTSSATASIAPTPPAATSSATNQNLVKDQKERDMDGQLKDSKQNKVSKQIIPFETEGMYILHL